MRQFVLGNPPTQHTPNGLVVRAYAELNIGQEFTLHPSQSLPKVDGDYVVHAGGKGKPHAIFCEVTEGASACIVKDGKDLFKISYNQFETCYMKCFDKKTIVSSRASSLELFQPPSTNQPIS